MGLFFSSASSAANLQVGVINYWHRPIIDVLVNEQNAGGRYGSMDEESGGGSLLCCVRIKPQSTVDVQWTLDGRAGQESNGKVMHAKAHLGAITPGATVLGVHIYPDGTVQVETLDDLPVRRPMKRGEK